MKSQSKGKFTPKRSDDFFYIEIHDIIERRDNIIDFIYDSFNNIKCYYLSSSKPELSDNIQCSIFWKTESAANNRLKSLQDKFDRSTKNKGRYKAFLKKITRTEYINLIQEGLTFENVYTASIYGDNVRRKKSEIIYELKFNKQYPQVISDILSQKKYKESYSYSKVIIYDDAYKLIVNKNNVSLFDLENKLVSYNRGELSTEIEKELDRIIYDKEVAMGRGI